MSDRWKLWLAGSITAILLIVAAVRVHHSLNDEAPAWLRPVNRQSPRLPKDVLAQYQLLQQAIDADARQYQVPVDSLQFTEMQPDGKEIHLWRYERFTNAGPTPLADFEVDRSVSETRLIGYYTLAGEPLHCRFRHHPTQTNVTYVTVSLPQPLNSTQSALVIGIERQPFTVRTNALGEITYNLGRFRPNETGIRTLALCLPAKAKLVKFTPAADALVATNQRPMVAWLNTRLPPNAPALVATFKLR